MPRVGEGGCTGHGQIVHMQLPQINFPVGSWGGCCVTVMADHTGDIYEDEHQVKAGLFCCRMFFQHHWTPKGVWGVGGFVAVVI